MNEQNHIYPIFDRMLTRKDKEDLLKQHSVMIWFTGLSGSGKSTLAIALERELQQRGLLCRILDGDNIRSGINNNLGFRKKTVWKISGESPKLVSFLWIQVSLRLLHLSVRTMTSVKWLPIS